MSDLFKSRPRRRAVLNSGLAAMAVAGFHSLGAGRAVASSIVEPAGAMEGPAGDWRHYVVGPRKREVAPTRVLSTTGDVKNPDGLLKPGGAVTVLTRPQPPTPPTWPAGTTATASSFHDPNNGNDGTYTTYDPSNAIDGNPATFWNDANPALIPPS